MVSMNHMIIIICGLDGNQGSEVHYQIVAKLWFVLSKCNHLLSGR